MHRAAQNMLRNDFVANRYGVMHELLQQVVTPGAVVVDIGAGSEKLSASVTCRLRVSLDILPEVSPSVICNVVDNLPLKDNSADVAVAGEILEHMTESRHFLKEIRRILRSKGWLILSVPNIVSLKYRLAFLIGRIPRFAARGDYTYSQNDPVWLQGHVRDYSYKEVCDVLADQGFHVISQHSIGLHWNGKRIIPPWLMPVTFSDNVIVKAILHK
jgi:SAM-dependent methyltransferase